jgi:hypothetical protein
MIISQAPIRDCSWSRRLGRDEVAMVRQRKPAYIDEQLFDEYRSRGFIPYLANLRSHDIFPPEIVRFLIDPASPRVSGHYLSLSGDNRVLAVAFPDHPTKVFQALGLLFLDLLKKLKAIARGEFDDCSVDDQITKLGQAYQQTATSMTIRASFGKVELVQDTSSRPFSLMFDEEEVGDSAGFKDTSNRIIKIEKSSRRR